MKLLGRVLILAACVFVAYAVPHIRSGQHSISSTVSKIKAEKACWNQYNQRQNEISQQLKIQTAACLDIFNQTSNSSNWEVTSQVDIIRTNLTTLQNNIDNCTAISDNLAFVQCVQNYNNMNMLLLNSTQQRAQNVEGLINNTHTNVNGNFKLCIENVMEEGTRNFTLAEDEYANCMQNVSKPIIIISK